MALPSDALMERAALYQIISNLKVDLESVLDIATGGFDGYPRGEGDLQQIASITKRALAEANQASPRHLYHQE